MSFLGSVSRWLRQFHKASNTRPRQAAGQALVFEPLEPRLMMSANTFPITIEVPGVIANRGIYAAVFGDFVGTATSGTGPSVYLTSQAGGTATTTTLSATSTSNVGPVDGNPISVNSVAGFPPSGNLVITEGILNFTVGYSGIDQASNSFTGTTFQPGSPGISSGATISLPNILGSTIPVDSTANFATSGSLMLESPPGAATPRNVVVYYTGITANSFTGVTGIPEGVSLPSGGTVVQMTEPGAGVNMAWATPPYGQNLPLINVFPANDGPYYNTNEIVSATLNLPDPTTNGILSGVIVISVGTPIAIPVTGSTSAPVVGTPTPATNLQDVFGVFEWGLTSDSLDFDVSEVDQVGFPFQVTSTGASPPPPADPNVGVGMLQDRKTLFDGFGTFINGLAPGSNAGVFLQGDPNNANAPFPTGTRITAPQDIIGTLEGDPPVGLSALPTGPTGSYTSVNAYYAITATSASGESMASNILTGVTGATNNQLQVTWQPYAYATGYNVYWSPNSDLSGAQLIASPSGGQNTSYTDTSPAGHTGNAATPPANNHTYDPLNSYFDDAIKDFFDYYRSGSAQFVLDDQATQTKWTGYTSDVNVNGTVYTMLQLTGGAGQWGSQFSGDTLNIYQPLFSSNTSVASRPPAPTWLTAQYEAYESPASMIFGADGVFGGVTDAGTWNSATTLPVGNAKDMYNNIVSAFNRGLTPVSDGTSWTNILPPNYWAASPLLLSAHAQTGGTLSSGQYRYWITALGINEATPTGSTETTPSNVIEVTVAAGQNQVELDWNAINLPGSAVGAMTAGSFNVYRSQLVSGVWTTPGLLNSSPLTNGPTNPLTSFTDNGYTALSTSPPFTYYADGTTSNFYSAYFSQLDVSINGLGYGFPFADKNGQSTNVQMPMPGPTGVQITLNPWTGKAVPDVTIAGSKDLVPMRGTLVIHGQGFNPVASLNSLKLSSGAGRVISVNPEGTRMTVTFTETPKIGALKAVVVNTATGGTSGKWVKVGSVVAAPLVIGVNAPPAFNITEDLPGNLVWSGRSDPFVSARANKLTVTLWVADGSIDAESGDGVQVGGTPTARTFSGNVEKLNAYFQTEGRITYTTAGNNHIPRELTTIISDGKRQASVSSAIRIAGENDAPTVAALPGTFRTDEDVPVVLEFKGRAFADIDSPLTTSFTVRMQVEAGAIHAASGAGVIVRGTDRNRAFVGTLADLNAFFTSGQVTYTPAQDAHGRLLLTTTISERVGGETFSTSTTTRIVIQAGNDAPQISVPEAFPVGIGGFALLTWPSVAPPFVDPDARSLSITLSVENGSISALSGQGVTVGGTPTARTFQGSVANLNAYFQTAGRITWLASGGLLPGTLTITASDGQRQTTATSLIAIDNDLFPWTSAWQQFIERNADGG